MEVELTELPMISNPIPVIIEKSKNCHVSGMEATVEEQTTYLQCREAEYKRFQGHTLTMKPQIINCKKL